MSEISTTGASRPMLMPVNDALLGVLLAVAVAAAAAHFLPAESQSKIWVKIFGSEWGGEGKGRVWTFLSVFLVVALIWGLLRWIPTNT